MKRDLAIFCPLGSLQGGPSPGWWRERVCPRFGWLCWETIIIVRGSVNPVLRSQRYIDYQTYETVFISTENNLGRHARLINFSGCNHVGGNRQAVLLIYFVDVHVIKPIIFPLIQTGLCIRETALKGMIRG